MFLHSRWEQRVQGLCDQFGQGSNGDFETSTGAITQSASEFAASWNVDPQICQDTYNAADYKACVSKRTVKLNQGAMYTQPDTSI